jgi:hypothetical protein
MRTELLKHYILALLAEGHFKAADKPTAIFSKVVELMREDFPVVVKDIANMAVEHGVRTVGNMASDKVRQKLDEVAADIGRRGFGAVWKDMQAAYQRGAAVKAGR